MEKYGQTYKWTVCLSCFSILGLRADAADDDIKRYYRRQAVLVHPDKVTVLLLALLHLLSLLTGEGRGWGERE